MTHYSPPVPTPPDDEISLVDLAATLVKRRLLIASVFVLFVVAGGLYALLAPSQYEYVSLLQVAKVGAGQYPETPAETIATLESDWWPGAQADYAGESGARLPFGIQFKNPKDTGLVQLSSETSPDNRELVKKFHQTLVDKAMAKQRSDLQDRSTALNRQLSSLDTSLQQIKDSDRGDSGAAIAALYEKKTNVQAQLQLLSAPVAVVVARQSAGSKASSHLLIIVLAAMLGMMAGVFLAFFAEFVGQVRKAL